MLYVRSPHLLRGLRVPRLVYLLAASLVAGTTVAILPSLAFQLAVVVGLAGIVGAYVLARNDQVLDPAWVVVAHLYLFVPVGYYLQEAGIGFSIVTALSVAFLPFAVGALWVSSEARRHLVLILPLAAFGGVAATSLAWTPETAIGSEKLILWAANGLLPAATIIVLYSARGSISWGLIALGAFMYALALLTIGEPWNPGSDRLTLYGQNPIWAARAVLVGTVVVIFGPFSLAVKAIVAPVTFVVSLPTGSLGPVVAVFVAVLAGTAEWLRTSSGLGRRAILGWTALALTIGLGMVVAVSGIVDQYAGPLLSDPNVSSRSDLLYAAAPLFASAPLTGIGLGGFAATGLAEYPHNILAEAATELGIVGIVVLTAWVLMAIRGAAGSPLLIAMVTLTGTFALFSGSLAGQGTFWLFSALAVATIPIGSQSASASRGPRNRPVVVPS